MSAGQAIGFVGVFAISLIPAGLAVVFATSLVRKSLQVQIAARIAAIVLTAALLAYGVVFHGGAVDDPASSSTAPTLPTKPA